MSPEGDRPATAVARGTVGNLAGAIVSATANFGLVVVIAHGVTPTTAGVFFAATSLFLMAEAMGRLGADTGLVYFIARWRATNEDERVRAGLRTAFGPVALCCGAFALLGIAFAPRLAGLIHHAQGDAVGLLRVLAVLLPLAAAYNVALGASRGFGWMQPTVLVDKIGRSAVQFGLVSAVLAFGWTHALGYAWALPYVLGFLVMTVLLRNAVRNRVSATPRQELAPRVGRQFWSFTLPRALASVAQILLQRLDIVLVATMRGAQDAAIYTAATRFLVMGQLVNQALTAPFQPQMSAAFASGDLPRARRLYQLSTAWLVLASWPLFGLAAVFAPVYVSIFGNGYRSGTTVVVILAVAMLVATGIGLVDSVIIMAGRSSWNLQTTLLALVINVSLDLALIPRWGIAGAAVGWLASILAANLVPLLIVWRRLGMHPFGDATKLACAVCGISCILVPLTVSLLLQRSRLADVLGIALAFVVYSVTVWHSRRLFGLTGLTMRRVARSGT